MLTLQRRLAKLRKRNNLLVYVIHKICFIDNYFSITPDKQELLLVNVAIFDSVTISTP